MLRVAAARRGQQTCRGGRLLWGVLGGTRLSLADATRAWVGDAVQRARRRRQASGGQRNGVEGLREKRGLCATRGGRGGGLWDVEQESVYGGEDQGWDVPWSWRVE